MALGITAVTPYTTTTNASSYTCTAFTPAANDLLVVFVSAPTTVAAGSMTGSVVSTFTKIGSAVKAASADTLYVFVADSLTTATSQTVSFACTGDPAAGVMIHVFRISGMASGRVGSSAVAQWGKQDNGAAGGTPTISTSTGVSGNAALGFMSSATSPPGVSQPSGWTEHHDQAGSGSPTIGAETCSSLTYTGTSVQWASTSATAYGALFIEIDASELPAGIDPFGMMGFFGV